MAQDTKAGKGPNSGKQTREDRLKAALKANMGRRKAQARLRTQPDAQENHDHAEKPADE